MLINKQHWRAPSCQLRPNLPRDLRRRGRSQGILPAVSPGEICGVHGILPGDFSEDVADFRHHSGKIYVKLWEHSHLCQFCRCWQSHPNPMGDVGDVPSTSKYHFGCGTYITSSQVPCMGLLYGTA